MSEQRERFLEDYKLNYYPISDLAERYSISRKTAHKWIGWFVCSRAQQPARQDWREALQRRGLRGIGYPWSS